MGADQRLDLDRQGARRPASGARRPCPARRRRAATAKWGRSPAGPGGHLDHATSPSAPNRFFPQESLRRPDLGSPSNGRTTSTACSRVSARQIAVLRHVTGHDDRDALGLANPTSASRTSGPATARPAPARHRGPGATGSSRRRAGRVAPRAPPRARPAAPGRDERERRPLDPRGGERAPRPGPATPRRRRAAGGPGSRQVRHQLEEKGRLADAGLPCEQGEGRRDDASSEDAVDAGPPGRDSALARLGGGEGHRRARRRSAWPTAAPVPARRSFPRPRIPGSGPTTARAVARTRRRRGSSAPCPSPDRIGGV